MKTRIVIETPEELVRLFSPLRNENDRFPFVGNDDVYLEIENWNNKTLVRFGGEDKAKYELAFYDISQHKELFVEVFKKAGIKLVIP
jgi:uncharacterized membrane protein